MLRDGDFVRVRRWNDMVNEFGYDNSSINCYCFFVYEMKRYCGQVYQIREISEDGVIRLNGIEGWNFSTDMLEDPETGKAVSIA